MSDPFDTLGTIGVEEEFYAVDPESLMPANASEDLLSDPPPELEDHIDTELFKFVMETTTEIAHTVTEARDQVIAKREALKDHARSYGYEIIGAGLHPGAKWRELDHIEKPRYQKQLDRIQYPQHRNITSGLHVHVGVDDADKAIWVCNEIRKYMPLMLALSANSPFWYGFDTGLKSARALIFENLPNTGMPTSFDSWENFLSFERRMLEDGSIKDRGEIWWDVRPNTEYGTVEVRSPDTQYDLEKTMGFIALSRALVLKLCNEYEKGKDNTRMRRELLDENKWRAIRHGHEASFLKLGSEEEGTVGMVEMLDETLNELEELEANKRQKLDLAENLLTKSGAKHQLEVYNETKNFTDVCDILRI